MQPMRDQVLGELQETSIRYGNLQLGQCYYCSVQNCISCSSSTNCTSCELSYYSKLDPASNSYICAPCPGNCYECQVINIANNAAPQCIEFIAGFTLNASNTCVSCKYSNCTICYAKNTSSCYQCKSGWLNNGYVC